MRYREQTDLMVLLLVQLSGVWLLLLLLLLVMLLLL